MQDVSSSLFESSTDGTAYHKKQLNMFKSQFLGFRTAGWVSLWTHGLRNPMAVQCIWHVSDNSKKCWSHSSWYSYTRWASASQSPRNTSGFAYQ